MTRLVTHPLHDAVTRLAAATVPGCRIAYRVRMRVIGGGYIFRGIEPYFPWVCSGAPAEQFRNFTLGEAEVEAELHGAEIVMVAV